MRLLCCCFLFLLSIKPTWAQDSLAQKMNWLSKAKPTTNLFVHFDKNVYANNETVYFTGYLLKAATQSIFKQRIMAVALLRDADRSVVLADKFIMQNGISFGSMTLPDSILTGNYHFVVYTDQLTNGWPDAVFEQAVTLKTNIDPAFKASMKLMSAGSSTQPHQVLVSVTSKDNKFLAKPTILNYQYGNLRRQAKTDPSGQLLITLPQQDQLIDPNLYLKLNTEKDSSFMSMALPQRKNKANVKFYPEGGNLVNGLWTTIGWEVKDQQQKPMPLKAFLYQNNQVIDTIETGSYGVGKFKLLPQATALYTVKLVHDGVVDSVYKLPKAINSGLTLTISEAVVTDTLVISLRANVFQQLSIRLHNFRTTFLHIPFVMDSKIRAIKIPLTEVAQGITAITISDSLGRPLAERLFFAHYNNNEKIKLQTDRQVYNQREKVNLNIKLDSVQMQGIVSIAVVQDNRITTHQLNDIESYTYLKNELTQLPVQVNGLPYKDKNYMEQVLLVKGWRRYTWQDLEQRSHLDTLVRTDSLTMTGLVTKANKELTAPIVVAAFDEDKVRTIVSTTNGYFDFKNPELIMQKSRRNYLFVTDRHKYDYQLRITDQFKLWNEKLAKTILVTQAVLPSLLANNNELVIKANEKSIRLNEVVIKSNIDTSINYSKIGGIVMPPANGMGDYVCVSGILNCPNHVNDPGNTRPSAGRVYMANGAKRAYKAYKTHEDKDPSFVKFNGIHLQKEFYIDDYKNPQEPAFFSTIYWNYGTLLNANKATTISFYTSDITGKFRIMVQGLTNKDVVYAERFFEVKPKQGN